MNIITNIIFVMAVFTAIAQPFVFKAQTPNNNLPVIEIGKALDSKSVAPLSSIASKIEYTIMDETVLLEDAEKAHVFYADEEFLYVAILNPINDTGCYIFTKEGKFVKDFAFRGRRGDEFTYLEAIAIAEDSKNIALKCGTKAIIFDFNGNFLTSIPIWNINNRASVDNVISSSIDFLDNDRLLLNSRDPQTGYGYAVVYNLEGQRIVRKKISGPLYTKTETLIPGKPGTIYARQCFSHWNGHIKLITQMDDIIYRLDEQMNILPSHILDFGKYRNGLTKDDWESNKILVSNKGFEESEHFIMFRITLGASNILPEQNGADYRTLSIIYDKNKKTTYALKYNKKLGITGFGNDLDNGMPFRPTKILGNKMYQFVNADQFISMAAQTSSAKMKEIAAKLTEESNPVLVTVTIL